MAVNDPRLGPRPNYEAFFTAIMYELRELSAGRLVAEVRPMGPGGEENPHILSIISFCLLRRAWTRKTLAQACKWLVPLHTTEPTLQGVLEEVKGRLERRWRVARILAMAGAGFCHARVCGQLPQELYQAVLSRLAALSLF